LLGSFHNSILLGAKISNRIESFSINCHCEYRSNQELFSFAESSMSCYPLQSFCPEKNRDKKDFHCYQG